MKEDIKVGDWIVVVLKDNSKEYGSVINFDNDEINMFDGKEGWSVDWSEVKEIKKEL